MYSKNFDDFIPERIHVNFGDTSVTRDDLRRKFIGFGSIKDCTVIANRGFGFIEFHDEYSARKAINSNINGSVWRGGHRLHIAQAKPKGQADSSNSMMIVPRNSCPIVTPTYHISNLARVETPKPVAVISVVYTKSQLREVETVVKNVKVEEQKHVLLIENLPDSYSLDKIRNFFNKSVGPVKDIEWCPNDPFSIKRSARVCFYDDYSVERAISVIKKSDFSLDPNQSTKKIDLSQRCLDYSAESVSESVSRDFSYQRTTVSDFGSYKNGSASKDYSYQRTRSSDFGSHKKESCSIL